MNANPWIAGPEALSVTAAAICLIKKILAMAVDGGMSRRLRTATLLFNGLD
jgi:hypothetical protein